MLRCESFWDGTCLRLVLRSLQTTAHPVLSVSAYGGHHSSLVASGGASKTALIWDLRIKGLPCLGEHFPASGRPAAVSGSIRNACASV